LGEEGTGPHSHTGHTGGTRAWRGGNEYGEPTRGLGGVYAAWPARGFCVLECYLGLGGLGRWGLPGWVGLGFDYGLRFGVEARVLTMGWVGLGFDHGLRWGR
jgi:hypothetical protein